MNGLWGRRIVALIIDVLIITLVLWIIIAVIYPIIAMANLFSILNFWLLLTALFIIGYFTYFEGKQGASLGKIAMKLRVMALEGEMNYKKAFIRNLSKIFWVPLVVDLIVGYAVGDSNDRYLSRLAKTLVVGEEELDRSRERLRTTHS
jgi:uncharacterized RDD family membrane protein YckC